MSKSLFDLQEFSKRNNRKYMRLKWHAHMNPIGLARAFDAKENVKEVVVNVRFSMEYSTIDYLYI